MKSIKLKNDTLIPVLGFGTWQLTGETCFQAVKTALEVGYRHIDTADRYGNHKEVAQAIEDSKILRSEIFLTTKVWLSDLSQEDVLKNTKRFLTELKTDYLDLLLIHWPNAQIPLLETLKALDQLKSEGKVKSIGVSNFTIQRLEEALKTGIEFVVNQIEFHPTLNQTELKDFCDKHHIIITAYSPLGQGEDLKLPLIQKLAQKYHKTPSQIILNWLICKNMVAIPRSSNPERIRENFESLDFELSEKDVDLIDKVGGKNRIVNRDWSEFKD